jgi:membrane associated rhomboid family serine protease
MFQSIWDDVKREFSYGNTITRIIIVNVAVFVVVVLVKLIIHAANADTATAVKAIDRFVGFLALASDGKYLLFRPWSIFTHMFLHEGVWHILWNMLFLYWFGRIVGDFIGNQRVLPIYLLGGLSGAVVYLFISNVLPIFMNHIPPIFDMGTYALGASAAVMGIVVAAGVISPDYIIRLLFFGDVKLKYIVGALVLLDLVALSNLNNTGGAFAHLGGAIMGWLFVRRLRDGNDWAQPVNSLLEYVSGGFASKKNTNRGPRMAYKNPNRPTPSASKSDVKTSRKTTTTTTDKTDLPYQERLDAILDKIKQSGYDSLTSEEKEFLFNASKK